MSKRATWGLVLLLVCSGAGSATAEVVPGQPDESIPQAHPIAPGNTYSGAFDDTSYDDVDYLAFTVTQPNQTFEFTVANTTANCVDPNDAGCPVYATLMDSTDHQVGGDSSDAGTIATNGDTEVFDWTFATPGTYYLLMESNGDLTPGNPTYSVSYVGLATPGGSSGNGSGAGGTGAAGGAGAGGGVGGRAGGGAAGAPLVRSFKVLPRQRGALARASVTLGRRASALTLTLLARRPGRAPSYIKRLVRRRGLRAGAYAFGIRLPPAWRARLKREHRLSVLVKLLVTDGAGRRFAASRPALLIAAAP